MEDLKHSAGPVAGGSLCELNYRLLIEDRNKRLGDAGVVGTLRDR